MKRRHLPLFVLLALPCFPLAAQTPARQGRPGWTPVRIAKWALLGAATGFAVYALTRSTDAEDTYSELRNFCLDQPDRCHLERGHYDDPAAEALYRNVVRQDRRAQIGIFGGQITLLGSVGLFIYDLRNGRGPANIPYPSSARALPQSQRGVGVGVRLSF